MGNVSTNNYTDSSEEDASKMKLNMDLSRSVRQELKQLLHWSLSEIRQIYAPFRHRKGSPVLNRSEFLRFIRLSRIASFYIYDNLSKNDYINVFEVVSILVLAAHSNNLCKIQFLFNAFDLSSSKQLNNNQSCLLLKSIVRGFCFLTNHEIPSNEFLQQYSQVLFSVIDINNNQRLEMGEVIGWLQNSSENMKIFTLYEPTIDVKEDYRTFNSFSPYTSSQVSTMMQRMNKIYNKMKPQEGDFELIKPIVKVRNVNKENSKIMHNSMHNSIGRQQDSTLNCINKNQRPHSKQLLPKINNFDLSTKRRKFTNNIIFRGRTITKKEIFELREYFDSLCRGKKKISIEDFMERFNQQKYNHIKSIAPSLFNFLDNKKNGQIYFFDLVAKLYPSLSKSHLEVISHWNEHYDRNFDLQLKTKEQKTVKKKVLPKTCILRAQEIFSFFDQGSKGFITVEDLRRVLGSACSEEEILYLFRSNDTNEDGKLDLKEFVHVLLPSDLQIEGLA